MAPTALITGMNGTLAPVVAREFERKGYQVKAWNRDQVPPDQVDQVEHFVLQNPPQVIAHLAMGPENWAGQLAGLSRRLNIPFLFTSTAMVFDHEPDGPHQVNDPRTAQDDYGRYKIRCEDAIKAASDQSLIVRIGWQIQAEGKGNNMIAALDSMMANEGVIKASEDWIPACSFMEDTAAGLVALVEKNAQGLFHLDSNAQSGWNFPTVVEGLKSLLGKAHWQVETNLEYRHDQRLADTEGQLASLHPLPSLADRLAS